MVVVGDHRPGQRERLAAEAAARADGQAVQGGAPVAEERGQPHPRRSAGDPGETDRQAGVPAQVRDRAEELGVVDRHRLTLLGDPPRSGVVGG
ncbi:hypothetical protein [Amycolatopsis sp. EV170708-02-1]|uniref:hypothetical protein n=1 Tax=Amycolatopsis sp. EV170708-02-1 TaxID=2919322 RepID=UPI001F0C3A00|nr:hypothetical protein [Amycolatopsis sp. EV170708-02-1]UMP04472.1 hypothetical protein MJQ72_06390 [Amycolatopsis sp. EV170708-02-1]